MITRSQALAQQNVCQERHNQNVDVENTDGDQVIQQVDNIEEIIPEVPLQNNAENEINVDTDAEEDFEEIHEQDDPEFDLADDPESDEEDEHELNPEQPELNMEMNDVDPLEVYNEIVDFVSIFLFNDY
jgi:hypothetical protein